MIGRSEKTKNPYWEQYLIVSYFLPKPKITLVANYAHGNIIGYEVILFWK